MFCNCQFEICNFCLSYNVSITLLLAEPCTNAQAVSKIYSTSNVLLASESVFLIESDVKCSNNPKVKQ